MSEEIKNLYKVVDKLEQRIKTNEDKINAFNNDMDAVIKVLTKMKKELYYTVEEDKKIEVAKAAAQKYEDELIEKNNQFQKEMKMKNITNKGEIDNDN